MTDFEQGAMASMAWWDQLLDDASAQQSDYEAEGWDATVLHTADVTPLDGSEGDRVGLSVLVPDDEFEHLSSILAGTSVERYEMYRTTVTGYLAFVLAIETADETAVLCPGYYALDDDSTQALFEQAVDAGELTVYVRRLDDTSVEVTLSEPELLAPPEDDGSGA